ncbi:MAG: type II toxin-antitoxin system antitoxin SocA domain-containing protein [Patescibacteria group bacterium]
MWIKVGNYKKEDIQKLKELLVFIVEKYEADILTETKLWKLAYFCESNFYFKNHRTITGINYYKNKFGPTPDYKVISSIMEEIDGTYIQRKEAARLGGGRMILYSKLSDYPIKKLSGEEQREILDTCAKYSKLNTNEIMILAHKDPPYLGADDDEKINFDFVLHRDDLIDNEECEINTDSEILVSGEAAKKLLDYAKSKV